MEAECLTKNLSYLNLNISRTKNGKSTRIKISGFPNWGRLVGGDNLDKMAKKCMKMTKSAFLGQNSGKDMGEGGQANFSGSGGNPGYRTYIIEHI